ncbi:MAG: hypothetical protein BM557_08400 [Flavobacterium sp. MedPE-SWcel]|uniref:DoxX family protein n=1 Tax=uncultured Flavobacterium sp. TaxID=165435 RepID=UPI00091CD3A8|nr:hypothetical protein [uncultured Flavobacterium sp.]OIQ17697.1 MAG: hypothetical protein BM557_08400 [Flavobacterium sp. MedPE-SWcel]
MKPLIILVATFLITLLIIKLSRGTYQFAVSGRLAMSAMLIFTAIGHFAFTKGMAMMIPEFIPYKVIMVYFTGIIEIIAAIGLLIPQFRVITAWCLILFFVLLLPVNILGAIKHVDYQNATYNGNGLSYLWFRVPLQVLFVLWVYITAIRY